MLLTISLISALVTGSIAIGLSVLSAASLLDGHRKPDLWAAIMIIVALVCLIATAHAIDRIREIDLADSRNRNFPPAA